MNVVRSSPLVRILQPLHYEVANESSGGGSVDRPFAEALGLGGPPAWGDSTAWQYWVIQVLKQYEQQMGYDEHPVGMTMQFPVADQRKVNEVLFNSPADWISPGYDDAIFTDGRHPNEPGGPASRWFENPPASEGRKVVITDTDHYAPGKGDALWAWKSFLCGHHPILMDFGLIEGVNPPDPAAGTASYESFEPARDAMGDTLRFAARMQLIDMEPRGDLSSTGYALANPGKEYLVLQPSETADPFTMTLDAGTYTVEWYSVNSREMVGADTLTVERSTMINLSAPFKAAGPVVVYLKKAGH